MRPLKPPACYAMLQVSSVSVWSAATPALYAVAARIVNGDCAKVDGAVVDEVSASHTHRTQRASHSLQVGTRCR